MRRASASGLNGRVITPKALITAAAATAVAITAAPALGAPTPVPTSGAAAGKLTRIVPGITYQTMTRPGPQRLHVVSFTYNVLTRMAPAQASGSLTRRATIEDGMASRLAQGATAGINGDFFSLSNGTPSGVLSVGPELLASPEPTRSSLAIAAGGWLSVGTLSLDSRYRRIDPTTGAKGAKRIVRAVNRPLASTSTTGVVVYTPSYGSATPSEPGYEVLVALDGGGAFPVAGTIQGTVIAQRPGGGTPIAPGQIVLSGKNLSGVTLFNEFLPGTRMEIEASIPGIAPDGWGAIGGGPTLVQDGRAVTSSRESFSSRQRNGRTTRSAVGQKPDGTILMVVSEGPQQGVRGYTMSEQAKMLDSLGLITAMGLDAGGSSMMAIGPNQVVPNTGSRPISDMLVAYYAGAQLSIPPDNRVTPNGDSVADTITLGAQSPVPGTTNVTVAKRGGGFSASVLDRTGDAAYTPIAIDPRALGMPEGPYNVTATLTPADGSPATSQKRIIVVDRTLGALRVSSRGAKASRRVTAAFTLSRPARVTAQVTTSTGRVVATLARNKKMPRGRKSVTWNGRSGKNLVRAGRYYVTVTASSSLGRTALRDRVRVR